MRKLGLHNWGIKKRHSRALLIFLVMAILHPFIANDKYIIGSSDKGIGLLVTVDDDNSGIKTIIPYSEKSIDKKNRNVGPLDAQEVSSLYYRHWLGTDVIGRDVLAGLIYGTAVAFKVGLLTTLIALIIGIILGFLSGYIGDYNCKISLQALLPFLILCFLSAFYIYYGAESWRWLFVLIPIGYIVVYFRFINYRVHQGISIPFDIIILRFIEVIRSIPGVFLLLVLLALFSSPSIWNVVIVIGFLRWPTVARHFRAEILKVRDEDFITSARISGLSHYTILKNYILPLTISPIIIVSAFGFATAILLESTLSFLGIGIPLDQVSWGSMLKDARLHISSWWLALFPGLMIYFVILLFNNIGDSLTNHIQKIEDYN